jgi:hypothetical protein
MAVYPIGVVNSRTGFPEESSTVSALPAIV